MRKVKKLKVKGTKQSEVDRKESELQSFKRIQPTDLHLLSCLHPDKLTKTLSNAESTERERAISRILLNPLIQKTITKLKAEFGEENVASFLKDNDKNITTNIIQKSYAKKEEENQPEDVTTITDSFFVTQTGTNYNVTEKPTGSSDEPKPKKKKKIMAKPKKPQKLVKTKVSPSKRVEVKPAVEKPRQQVQASVKPKPAPKPTEKPLENVTDEPVHPSWKAKAQMRKNQMQSFEGTKIKFDDDD